MKVGEHIMFIGSNSVYFTNNKLYEIYEFEKRPHIRFHYIVDNKGLQIKVDLNEKRLNGNWIYVPRTKYRKIKLETIKNNQKCLKNLILEHC